MTNVTEDVVGLTKELVKFETTKTRLEELRKCTDFVKSYFKGTGLIIQEFEREGKPSLLIGFEKSRDEELPTERRHKDGQRHGGQPRAAIGKGFRFDISHGFRLP